MGWVVEERENTSMSRCNGGQTANSVMGNFKEMFTAEKKWLVSKKGKREKSYRINPV